MDWLRQYIGNLSNLKFLLGLLVLMIAITTVAIDFRDVSPDWDLFSESPSSVESYGAKAAILALLGAAAVFIGFIPSGSSGMAKGADILVRLTGALMLAMTGLFWLLNATGGRPGPYLFAYVPTVIVYAFVMVMFIAFRYMYDLDQKQIQEEGKAVLSLKNFLVPIALIGIAFALVLVVLYLARIMV